jgi:hypothetical protein
MSRRKSGLLLAGVALLLGMTACSGSESGSSTASLAGPMAPGAAPPKQASGSADSAAVPGAPKQEGAQKQESAPVQERKLVQTARMEMTVPDAFEAISRARSVATDTGGYTGQEESSGDKASIVLRIPADRFDDALTRLAKLGNVTAQNKQADDVTDQVVDLDARLATQRASVDRMRGLLARAATVTEIAQIEGELTRREADLESLQGRRDSVGGKVALSTVTLQVTKNVPAPPPVQQAAGGGFLSGLDGGWGAFGDVVGALATAFGALLPFLVALGIPAGLVLYFRRKRRKPAPAPESATAQA